MKKQLRYVLGFVALVLLGLFIWRTEYGNNYVIEPVARILWLFYRTLRSVDQNTYWMLLIFVALLLVFRVLPESNEVTSRPAYEKSNKNNDRVLFWETLIKAAETDRYHRMRLEHGLQTLSQSIDDLSFTNDQDIIHLPSMKTSLQGWVQKTYYLSPLYKHNQRRKTNSLSELETCVDQILKSMEMKMEGNHDGE